MSCQASGSHVRIIHRREGEHLRFLLSRQLWKALLDKKNSVINLAIINYTINRRNRRASDDPQDAQRDRQTQKAGYSSKRLAVFLLCIVFHERMVQVAITWRNQAIFWWRRPS